MNLTENFMHIFHEKHNFHKIWGFLLLIDFVTVDPGKETSNKDNPASKKILLEQNF